VVAALEVAKRPEHKGKMIVTIACSTGNATSARRWRRKLARRSGADFLGFQPQTTAKCWWFAAFSF
jgi:hypothetical protein